MGQPRTFVPLGNQGALQARDLLPRQMLLGSRASPADMQQVPAPKEQSLTEESRLHLAGCSVQEARSLSRGVCWAGERGLCAVAVVVLSLLSPPQCSPTDPETRCL